MQQNCIITGVQIVDECFNNRGEMEYSVRRLFKLYKEKVLGKKTSRILLEFKMEC